MKENRKVYARTIPADSKASRYPDTETAVKEIKERKALAHHEKRLQYVAMSDKIAQSLDYIRNWKWPGSEKIFPDHPDLRIVEKYYPYAKGGPLLVDEPRDKIEIEWAYRKQKFLKAQGLRHVVIEENATLYEILEQLGEV